MKKQNIDSQIASWQSGKFSEELYLKDCVLDQIKQNV